MWQGHEPLKGLDFRRNCLLYVTSVMQKDVQLPWSNANITV